MGFLTGNKKISTSGRSFMGKIPRRVELEKGIIKELKPYERRKYKEYFSGAKVGSKSIKSLAQDLFRDQGAREKRKFLAAVKEHYEKKFPVLSKEQIQRNISGSRMSEIIKYEEEKGGIGIKDRAEEAHRRAHEKRFAGSEADLGAIGYQMRKEEGAHFAAGTQEEKRTSISDASNKLAADKKPIPPSINKPPVNP